MSIKITFAGAEGQPCKQWTEEAVREHGAFASDDGDLRFFRRAGPGVYLNGSSAEESGSSAAKQAELLNALRPRWRPVDVEIIVRERKP